MSTMFVARPYLDLSKTSAEKSWRRFLLQKLSYVLCKNQTRAVEGVEGVEGEGEGEIVNRSHRDREADELAHCDVTSSYPGKF